MFLLATIVSVASKSFAPPPLELFEMVVRSPDMAPFMNQDGTFSLVSSTSMAPTDPKANKIYVVSFNQKNDSSFMNVPLLVSTKMVLQPNDVRTVHMEKERLVKDIRTMGQSNKPPKPYVLGTDLFLEKPSLPDKQSILIGIGSIVFFLAAVGGFYAKTDIGRQCLVWKFNALVLVVAIVAVVVVVVKK